MQNGAHISRLVTAPAGEVVSLADMKLHLRIDGDAEDGLVGSYIAAAVASLDGDGELSRAILTQTWSQAFRTPTRDVYLHMNPVASVSSIKYFDKDNTEQTLAPSDYALYAAPDWAFVRSEAWPGTFDRPDAIKIEYVTGEATAPENIAHAVKLIVSHWYQNREETSEVSLREIPRGAASLIELSRLGWYG